MRIGKFFRDFGRGFVRGFTMPFKWIADKGKKIIGVADKVIPGAKKLAPFLPGKWGAVAGKVLDKSDEAIRRGKDIYDKGQRMVEAGRSIFNR